MSVLAAVIPDDASYSAVLRAAGELAGAEAFEVATFHPGPANHFEEQRTAKARNDIRSRIEQDLAARSLNASVSVPLAGLGHLGDEIVAHAERAGARVIVIGTRGRTGLSLFFMGSVAEHVVRHARCDVYVARPPPSD